MNTILVIVLPYDYTFPITEIGEIQGLECQLVVLHFFRVYTTVTYISFKMTREILNKGIRICKLNHLA